MHVIYVIFVIKMSCWCLHEFGVEHEREKMQGHHCIPANTARLAPRFWGRPIPRAKIGLPAKPRRQNPPFFLRFGLNGRYRQTAKTADTGKLDEKPVDVEIAHNYKRGHVSVFSAIKST